MNPNPNQNSRHHQQLPNEGSSAGNCSNGNNVLVYINQQQQKADTELGGLSSLSQNQSPMPPSSWVKCSSHPSHLQQQPSSNDSMNSVNNANCSASASSSIAAVAASYGASSSSYNQQHSFYTDSSQQQQTEIRYAAGRNGNNQMRPNPNYNNISSNNGMYYPVDSQSNADSCQYYQQQQQQNTFLFDHHPMKNSSSCDVSNVNVNGVSTNNSNFYGFYSHNHVYHQEYQNQVNCNNGSNTSDDSDYTRVHHQQHYHNHHEHHHQQHHQQTNVQSQNHSSIPTAVQGYFGIPSASSGPSMSPEVSTSARHGSTYGHQQHQQVPFRRNSIESYSSEPGDLPYNTKYGCNFPSAQYGSPSSSSSLVKRETLSCMAMSAPSSNSQWPRDNTLGGHGHSVNSSHGHGYFFNSHSQQNQSHRHFSNVNVNQNNLSGDFQQQQMQSFKSCSFEQQELRVEELKVDGHVSSVGTAIKAAAVKHRSLSLSLPLSSFPRSDLGSHTHRLDQGHSHGHSHLNTSTNNLSINPFDEIESSSSVVPVNPNSDHPSQCKVNNCNGNNDTASERTSAQCENFMQTSEEIILEEVVETQSQVEINEISSCPSQSNLTSEVSNSDSGGSNFPEIVTSANNAEPERTCSNTNDNKADLNLISTTTADNDNENVNVQPEIDPNNSSSCCSLGIFGNSNSVSNLTLIVGDSDSESCMSGISSFSGSNSKGSPQKISKRSFSEADKDLVINTTAVSFGGRRSVLIPKGWKRETSSSPAEKVVFYTSPSGTKLRTWEELKNYICSDGTCKCGLSCPLRLEHTFSFDLKVTNLCQEEDESLLNLNETGTETRLLCSHKRKIPKSEDSPLISSTRDDLGDCGEKKSKKRRTSGIHNENLISISQPKRSPSTTSSHHVPVPFSQQSPDTTTQTPQTDMSPASSVSSEPSSGTIFSSAGGSGSRSTSSTPTPTSSASSSGKVSTPPPKGQTQCGFAWPPPPSSQSQTPSFWANPSSSGNNNNATNSNSIGKKSGYQHHLIPKVVKRSNSPCPNIDVRQIPLEQNRPPPRQNSNALRSSSTAGSSHPNQNPNLSFFPITSSHGDELHMNMSMNMNTGYSISPVPSTTNHTNTLQFAQTVVNANMSNLNANTLPIQIQRVLTGATASQNASTLIQQTLPSSITISMVGQQLGTNPSGTPASSQGQTNFPEAQVVGSEKSPLQLVQDVVDRFHSNPKIEEGSSNCKDGGNGSNGNAGRKELNNVTGGNISVSPVESSTSSDSSKEMNNGELIKKCPATPVCSGGNNSEVDPSSNNNSSKGNKTEENLSVIEIKASVPSKSIVPISFTSTVNTTVAIGVPLVSFSTAATTTTVSSAATVPIMTAMSTIASTTSGHLLNCTASAATSNTNTLTLNPVNNISTITTSPANQQLILQQQSTDQTNTQNSAFLTATTAGPQSIRYPIFQTIQPIFLNSSGGPGGSLIISPQSQPHQGDTMGQQSFIYDHHAQHQATTDQMQPMLQQTTMVLDPSVCGNAGGPKKKKKRLSKKQQQQQAQLQLQQQLLLQQLHQQAQQQQAAATIPLTIFPQSFNLGPQGFSLQPMNMNMNFFPTPTILTLPNLILNPADGTLFLQPSAPMSAATAQSTVKLPQFQLAHQPAQQQHIQQPNLIAPKKDHMITTTSTTAILTSDLFKASPNCGDTGSDDSRQNATPDSSTNDLQLGLTAPNPGQQNSITVSLPPHTTLACSSQKKVSVKSKTVSSSSSAVGKRIFTQKQILPKIDSTTPSVENG